MSGRYRVVTAHVERHSIFYVVDTAQPEAEQPSVVAYWTTATEPNARFLADDFCERHNAKGTHHA